MVMHNTQMDFSYQFQMLVRYKYYLDDFYFLFVVFTTPRQMDEIDEFLFWLMSMLMSQFLQDANNTYLCRFAMWAVRQINVINWKFKLNLTKSEFSIRISLDDANTMTKWYFVFIREIHD